MVIIALLGIAGSVVFAVCGILMACNGEVFLTFHDKWINRNPRHRDAEWRTEVDTAPFKVVGCMIGAFGVFLVVIMTTRLLAMLQ